MSRASDEQQTHISVYIGLFMGFPMPSLIAMGLMIFKKLTDFHDLTFKIIIGLFALKSGFYFLARPAELLDLSIVPVFKILQALWGGHTVNLWAFAASRIEGALYLSTLLWWAYYILFIAMDGEVKGPKLPKPRKERYNVRQRGDDIEQGVYLGSAGGYQRFYLSRDELIKHTALVGTTGSGKTTTIYNFVQYGMLADQSLLVIDGKGDLMLARKVKTMAREYGRPFYLFSTGDSQSLGYNPLATGNPTELTDKIMALTEWTEEHYKLSGQRFLQLLFRVFAIKGIEPDLVNVVKYSGRTQLRNLLFDVSSEESTYDEPKEKAKNSKNAYDEIDLTAFDEGTPPKAAKAAKKGKKETASISSPELRDIATAIEDIDRKAIDGLAGRLGVLAEGDLGGLLKRRSTGLLELTEAMDRKGVILFSLDSLSYPEQARLLGRLVVADIKSQISYHARHRPGERVSLIFDEFNVFVSGGVVDLVNKSRAAGFEALLAFQSLADIDRLERGKEIRRQIIQNCNTLIVQRQNDPTDAEELANIIGTKTGLQYTFQVSDEGPTGLGSARPVKQYKQHPDEIKSLKVGQAIVKYHSPRGVEVAKIQVREL
jgi:DNA helicase HerA-like ATPase